MDGLSPCEHIESIMEEYRINKELERKRKVYILSCLFQCWKRCLLSDIFHDSAQMDDIFTI